MDLEEKVELPVKLSNEAFDFFRNFRLNDLVKLLVRHADHLALLKIRLAL